MTAGILFVALSGALVSSLLPLVNAELLLIAGGISGAEMTLLAEGLRSFRIDRVDDAGHFVFEENPEAVVAAVGSAFASARLEGRIAARQPVVNGGPRP